MKKIISAAILLTVLMGMGSCDYDDSNDIDIIRPNDSTRTSIPKINGIALSTE